MKNLPLVLRFGSGVLALSLCLLPPVLRAEDGAGKLSKAKQKYDTDKDGKLSAEEKTKAREAYTAQTKAKEADKLKEELEKYDANGNGQLDDSEKAQEKADVAARAEKYEHALAKYDTDHNGKLDRDEMKKMSEDELLADRTERQSARDDAKFRRKRQKEGEATGVKMQGETSGVKVRKH